MADVLPYAGEPCLDCGSELRAVEVSESRTVYRCDAGHGWTAPADAPPDDLSLRRCPALDEEAPRG